jgi:hypothetical protein
VPYENVISTLEMAVASIDPCHTLSHPLDKRGFLEYIDGVVIYALLAATLNKGLKAGQIIVCPEPSPFARVFSFTPLSCLSQRREGDKGLSVV